MRTENVLKPMLSYDIHASLIWVWWSIALLWFLLFI